MNSNPRSSSLRSIIFTDLDGSLLSHDDYNFEAAKECLDKLEADNVPVICATSKTFAELLELRQALNNRHPFIVENGAAVYIPKDYFKNLPADNSAVYSCTNDYHCFAFV